MNKFFFFFILGLLTTTTLISQSVNSNPAQWRGSERDGKYDETGLMKKWPESGPELILKVDSLGKGWSSVIYANNMYYLTGMKDTLDYLSAINQEGEIVWQVPFGRSWVRSFPDTRGTPHVEEDRVYVIGGIGDLSCFNAFSGEEIWSVNVDEKFEAEWATFGVAESPLIYKDLVMITPGGEKTTMLAFNKYTGELAWQSESVGGKRIYASPGLYQYNGVTQVIGTTKSYVFGVLPEDGSLQWKYSVRELNERTMKRGANLTNTPLFHENEIFVTSGYDVPSVKLSLTEDGKSVTEVWKDTVLDNHHHGVVLIDGYIYGSNWHNNKQGMWVCMEWDSGEVMYEHEWGTKGSIIYADSMLYMYEERNGNVGLVNPTPEKFDLISSFKVEDGDGPYWAHPTIYDGKLCLRHGEVMLIYNIREKSE